MAATYTPLATVTLGASASSVTFSSIPATYRDLILVFAGTTSDAVTTRVRFNGDTGSNYPFVDMGSAVGFPTFSGSNTQTGARIGAGSTAENNTIANIMDYSATDKHTTILSRGNSGTSQIRALCSRWADTAAVNSIFVFIDSGTFSTGSTFSLYGVIA
jgi:hypothetical protein